MAEAVPFVPVKLICGILAVRDTVFAKSMEYLEDRFGTIDHTSPLMEFTFTDYYRKEMGSDLKRKFVSFDEIVAPDFSHRIPLRKGIYAHLELLFGKKEAKTLMWTYPDFRTEEYQRFFLEVRKIYLAQLKTLNE
jgi:hypothetical protein